MRKHLLAVVLIAVCGSSSALAKPAVYSWNGFYVGAHAGSIWGDVNVTDDVNDGVPPGPFGYSISGFIGGGTVGYNLQVDNVVFGIDGDLGVIDPDGSGIIPSSTPPFHQDTTLDTGLHGDIQTFPTAECV